MYTELYRTKHARKREEEHRDLVRDVDLNIEIEKEEVVVQKELKDATSHLEQHLRRVASQDSILALFPKESELLNFCTITTTSRQQWGSRRMRQTKRR